MKQCRQERNELLKRLKTKMGEMKEKGKDGIVSLNIKKPKRSKIVKEKSVYEIIKTSQPPKEKKLSTDLKGIVKWFNLQRGYGFIVGEDKKDYFAHHSNIVGEATVQNLAEGDEVRFQSKSTDRGFSAIKIVKQEKTS